MNDSLLPIYRAVAEGRLTRAEALAQIKALRLRSSDRTSGVVLATRDWRPAPARATETLRPDRILLWGIPQETALALRAQASAVERLEGAATGTVLPQAIDDLFSRAAKRCFDAIRSALANVTAGAASVDVVVVVADGPDSIVAAGFEAMFRTAMEENPALVAHCIRVPADVDGSELSRVVAEASSAAEARGIVRYMRRGGVLEREVARWRVLEQYGRGEDLPAAPVAFKEGGCYLITGGAGGIGLRFAREIAGQTTRARVLLAGRSALSPDAVRTIDAFRGPGHRVEHVRLDVSQAGEMDALAARLRSERQPLDGIIHCAGIIRDSFIIRKTAEEFGSVLAPKVAGLVNLDRATRDEPLDFILLCSSVAACWGIVGQVDYAAANAFMDAFAGHRNRLADRGERSGRTLSVNWPLWQDGGMTVEATALERLQDQTGMQLLGTATAMRAFHRGVALAPHQLLVMEGDIPVMLGLLEQAEPARRVVSAGDADVAAPSPDAPTPRIDDEFKARSLDYITRQFSQVLKIPVAKLRPQAPLEQSGIDSILAMKLVTHLESIFGRLPKTLAFEYQTIAQLNEYFCASHGARLADVLFPRATPAGPVAEDARQPARSLTTLPSPQPSPLQALERGSSQRHGADRFGRHQLTPVDDRVPRGATGTLAGRDTPRSAEESPNEPYSGPIAIVGLSGRYPDAWDLDAYWENLSRGRDCIREIPAERWRWQDFYRDAASGQTLADGQHTSKWGGFIEGADEFNPRFFNITPRDAEQIDPQERVFLQHAWMAMEDAGYTRAALQAARGGQVGVYAGVMYGEYNRSGSLASIANRVSYVLNLHGPSLTLDTMCSSSLSAIHLACQDLRGGRTDLAIAGGVNLSLHPGKYSMLSAGQFISTAGHCQSFGEGGDGYIPGEGVGVVVLKRLADAEREGDAIHAVIRGSALNHGGKTNGYTVPNPQAQAAVITAALAEAGVEAGQVSYLEAHGTGTKLGDPIEIAAISKAFRAHTAAVGFCLIGSAKSNIGHCESAAGVAGLTKVILQLRHRQIVPSLHSARLNPHIDFATTPFVVNQELRAWETPVVDGRPVPRLAGVSSFGAGGSNAHIVVEEYVPRDRADDASGVRSDASPWVVLLSGRTLPQLRQRAEALKAFVENDSDIDLRALAYTLQVGREAMEERLAMRVGSRSELIAKLDAFLASDDLEDGALTDDLYYAQSRRHRDVVDLFGADDGLQASIGNWFESGKLSRLLDVWTRGVDVDWRRLYGASLPGRMHLPVYAFARERYWREEQTTPAGLVAQPHALHSLLHRNASKPGLQCYRSEFRADDPRIAGLRWHGLAGLPHAVQIEAARAALADALPALPQGGVWELQDVRFAAPRAAGASTGVDIVVLPSGQGLRPSLSKAAFELSIDDASGVVCCQGLAEYGFDEKAPKLDIAGMTQQASILFADTRAIADAGRSIGIDPAALYHTVQSIHRTAGGLLLRLGAPEQARAPFADCVINPAIVETALLCAQWLRPSRSGLRLPAGFASLRLYPADGLPRYAWVRAGAEDRQDDVLSVDLSICGEDGTVFLQFRDLELKPAAMPQAVTEITQAVTAVPQAAAVVLDVTDDAGEIASPQCSADVVFRSRVGASAANEGATLQEASASRSEIARLRTIALDSPESAATALRVATVDKPSVPLTLLAGPLSVPLASAVLQDRGDGIRVLRLQPVEGRLDAGLADVVEQALAHARELPALKLLVVESGAAIFLQDGDGALDADGTEALLRTLASFPAPTAAVLAGRATGAGLRFASTCDFVMAVEDQEYGFATPERPGIGRNTPTSWFAARFGEPLAPLLASSDRLLTGRELRDAGWGATVVSRGGLTDAVDALCRNLSDKSPGALRLLKTHLAREFDAGVVAMNAAFISDEARPALIGDTQEAAGHEAVELQRIDGNGFSLRLKADGATGDDDLLRQLGRTLRACREADVVLLHSDFDHFLPGGAARHADLLREALSELSRLRMPVIAVVEKSAIDAGLLLVLACDLAVYSEEGRYGGLSLQDHRTHLGLVDALVSQRLGIWGSEWVLSGDLYDGHALRRRMPLLHVCQAGEASSRARRIAEHLLVSPRGFFDCKSSLAAQLRHPASLADNFGNPAGAVNLPVEQGELALTSNVVRASVDADGVVLVRLEDRADRNMFSDALIAGLQEVFDRIPRLPNAKAVVLVGYDTYFASGGTQQGLKAIQEGKVRFTDIDVFQLPMRCPLPVIAAMQGHGIGAGWTLGLFCDSVVFSEESRYVSPYLNFGFTPGAGATGVLPAKLGFDLARESLFTGAEISGQALGWRNPLLTVLGREHVLTFALALARKASRHDRRDLVAWKAATVAHRFDAWQALFAREVEMHEATLVGQADALAGIERRFGPPPSSPVQAKTRDAAAPAPAVVTSTLSPTPAHAHILPAIRRLLAEELRLAETEIDSRTPFIDLGLDSISSVTWIRRINERFALAIEATKVYSYPTIEKFARLVRELLPQAPANPSPGAGVRREGPVEVAAAPEAPAPLTESFVSVHWPALSSWRTHTSVATTPQAARPAGYAAEIAVIGMAGRFPMAQDVDAFWDNIASGRNCISEVPASRWDTRAYYVEGQPGLGQSNSKWMGVLEGHDRFDPLFFGLSPIEAESMDPQQRLFLQCCWHGMEDAGYTSEQLSGSKCGVFVGCASADYNLLSREQQIGALGFTGGATSILAARASYFLNLQGPCVSIDTACSSSLVAIASACDSLVTGASDLAFAGGVYVMANADMFLKTSHAGMLSPDGRCYTFDQRANGFVPGEGVGVVMLKRLADAERDGDRIVGVLRGWGVNQDGRTNGITAPNAESQQRLITDVYARFKVDPRDIQLIEAHGTGTKLGDPIEIDGLKSAFRPSTDRKGFCAIGSVKTNIGHCLTAAGVSGLIKLLLALKHRQLPPSINFETPNEHLDLDDSPFFVNTTLRDWAVPPGVTRQAAISSFGFSGTNAHVVVAEHMPHREPTAASSPGTNVHPDAGVGAGHIVPLSARTPERLRQKAMDLRDFVQADPGLDLASLAGSLQIYRDAMDERLCFVARRAQDVIDVLTACIDGTVASALPGGVFAGNVKQGRDTVRWLSDDAGMAAMVVDKCIADGNLDRLCELWVKGWALDWRKLRGPQKPAVIALPKYPFADDAYWIAPDMVSDIVARSPRDTKATSDESAGSRQLHPLLQEKLTDLRELGYRPSTGDDQAAGVPALMHLPTYAFARVRCWIPPKEEVLATSSPGTYESVTPSTHYGRFLQNLDSIADLFAELEEDKLTENEVAVRVRQLA